MRPSLFSTIPSIPSTARIEAYSDGIFAIVVTLLALELRIPDIKVLTNAGAQAALLPLVPSDRA